jgi:hypothetical protein
MEPGGDGVGGVADHDAWPRSVGSSHCTKRRATASTKTTGLSAFTPAYAIPSGQAPSSLVRATSQSWRPNVAAVTRSPRMSGQNWAVARWTASEPRRPCSHATAAARADLRHVALHQRARVEVDEFSGASTSRSATLRGPRAGHSFHVRGRRTVVVSGQPVSRSVLSFFWVRSGYLGGERGDAVGAGAGVRGGPRD